MVQPAWTKGDLAYPHLIPDKAQRVRRMFDAIAPNYEKVNGFFSVGRDRYWRRRAVEMAEVRADDEVLDVACGTGDLARVFASARPRRIIGCDFSHAMLLQACRSAEAAKCNLGVSCASGVRFGRLAGAAQSQDQDETHRADSGTICSAGIERKSPRVQWCEADGLSLPFAEEQFSIVSCAFGVRNFQNLDLGLREMCRVLRRGGRMVILEFSRPGNRLIRSVYEFYSARVMPRAASWVSGDRSGAYRYLPRSVLSFPDGAPFCRRVQAAGFSECVGFPLTLGVVTVYLARRDA